MVRFFVVVNTRTFERLIASIDKMEYEQADEIYAVWCRLKTDIGLKHLHQLIAALYKVRDPKLMSLENEVREMYLGLLLASDTKTLLHFIPSVCRLDVKDEELQQRLAEHLEKKVDQVDAGELASLFTGLIRSGGKSDCFVDVVFPSLLQKIESLETKELTRLAKTLTLSEKTRGYLRSLSSEFLRRRNEVDSFNPYGAIALLASLADNAPEDVEAATRAVKKIRGEGRSYFAHAPSLILSSLSRLRHLPKELDEAIGEWIPWITPSNLSRTIQLLSRTGRFNREVASLLAKRAIATMDGASLDTEIAAFIHFKRMEATDYELKRELEARLVTRIKGSSVLALSWALVRICELDYRDVTLVELILEEVRGGALCDDPWLLLRLMQSMSQLLRKDDELLDRIWSSLLPLLPSLPDSIVADIACVFAQLCYFRGEAIEYLEARVLDSEELVEECLPKLAWSFAILNPTFARELLHGVWSSPPNPELSERELMTIYHVLIALDLPILPVWRLRLRKILSALSTPPSNSFEQEVGREIDSLAFSRSEQQQVAGYFIDHVIWLKEEQVALGCDGNQYHYLNWDPSVGIRGADILRDQILEKRGYKVVHLPGEEWRSSVDRRELLRDLILRG